MKIKKILRGRFYSSFSNVGSLLTGPKPAHALVAVIQQ
jgi:hypothetical protein